MSSLEKVLYNKLSDNQYFVLAEEFINQGHSRKNSFEMAGHLIETMSKLLADEYEKGTLNEYPNKNTKRSR